MTPAGNANCSQTVKEGNTNEAVLAGCRLQNCSVGNFLHSLAPHQGCCCAVARSPAHAKSPSKRGGLPERRKELGLLYC